MRKEEFDIKTKNYSTTILVDETPEKVFDAVNNPRGWWSEDIEGDTDKLGSEFKYLYKEVHICRFKITEFVPGKKVVWHVLDNYFNFTKDKSEWKNTDVVFEISRMNDKTQLRFTHVGLIPSYECYNVCSDAWGSYINGSLRNLIAKGKGNPNPLEEVVSKARQLSDKNYTTSFFVDKSPDEVFAAVNNVRGWWSENIVGNTDIPGGEFTMHHEDLHHSTQKITIFVPGKKVVWHIVDSRLNFLKDKKEWNGTDVEFEINRKSDKTELQFTHIGLVPSVECFDACTKGWSFYINNSLRNLITAGKGQPAKS